MGHLDQLWKKFDYMTEFMKNYFGGFLKIVTKIQIYFLKSMFLEFSNKYVLLGKFSKCSYLDPFGRQDQKKGKNANTKSEKVKKNHIYSQNFMSLIDH